MTFIKAVSLMAVLGSIATAGVLYAGFGAFLPWREEEEVERVAKLIGLRQGQVVAEIGAGGGRFTVAMARTVGPAGHVYSTELKPEARTAIEARARAAGLANVITVEASPVQTNLPSDCCDLVLIRNVYHHVREVEQFTRSVRDAVKPDGRLVVADFEPGALWFHGGRPGDASERRPGHGVARADAIAEFRRAGFRVEREIADWSGPMWLVVLR